MLKYDFRQGLAKTSARLKVLLSVIGISSVGLVTALSTAGPAGATSAVVYNNIPSPQPGNVVSEAFEATSTSEFGGQVQFAGTERTDPTVTVLMSSWGCEFGHWYSNDCVTSSGATFSEPITLNVYNVGAGNAVGSLVTTLTTIFNIPYRPSASPVCADGRWSDGTTCYNGFATPVSFNTSGVTLPNMAIVTVAYNTTHYGNAPIGQSASCFSSSGGCGYDSLNVGLVNAAPTVGNNPVTNSDYLNSAWSGAYCDNGVGGTGSLRFDTGNASINSACPYQPAFTVNASAPPLVGSVTGGLTLKNPRQQISFSAFDYGANSSSDNGTVEYQNFEYPGGLHYTASVICATVSGRDATFMFQIPDGFPGLSGQYVIAKVHDGGSPGTKDTYGHTATGNLATAQAMCESGNPGVTNYVITGGNAVVH